MIVSIPLKLSNAYLIIEEQPILVDTGSPGEEGKIKQALQAHNLSVADLALIIHTHAHVDHAGSSAALQKKTAVPLAVHPLDAPLLRRGENGPVTPINWEARLVMPFVIKPYKGAEPNILLEDGFELRHFGVRGKIFHTPGHTAGSLSILLESGDAIVGDLLMGGYLGGTLLPTRPRNHYFVADSLDAIAQSVGRLMRHQPHTLYVGHGGPLTGAAVAKKFIPQGVQTIAR